MTTRARKRTRRDLGVDPSRECFVIMPFGEKVSLEGAIVKFDDIYTHLLAEAIADAGFVAVRCDKVEESGLIHRKMLEHIRDARVSVVDISLLNANVFYELGVRHTLRKSATVLVRRKGTTAPFNIANLSVIEYDETDIASVAQARLSITESIKNGVNALKTDSLVHEVLDLNITSVARRLTRREEYVYAFRGRPTELSILSGGIENVDDVDVWVNAENTNMQMARFYDWSVSSVIRYLGARRDITGHVEKVEDDLIANELTKLLGGRLSVPPGTVIPTGSGELCKSHNVKKIFHAAVVQGEVGEGYMPISNVAACVTRALQQLDSPTLDGQLSSIAFPLLGAGVAPQRMPEIVHSLIEAAVNYVSSTPTTAAQRICFLVWNSLELDACLAAANGQSELRRIAARA